MTYGTPRLLVVCRILAVTMVGALSPATASAQTATLSGVVRDESGANVSGASIVLANDAIALRRDTITSDQGTFSMPLLPPGRYVLQAQMPGFQPVLMEGIVLNVNDQVSVNVRFKVAPVEDTVTVVAEPSRVDISPAVDTVIDRGFVGNLPLNGRTLQSLIGLTPGVVLTMAASGASGPESPGQFSVNGQRTNANYFTVDGVSANVGVQAQPGARAPGQEGVGATPAMNAIGGTQSLVSIEALEEFNIQTSTYSAEFGRQPGGQIALVTRSGTNRFQGTIFDAYRDDALDATDWFVKANSLQKAESHQDQFGAVLGGPVVLPGYNGRDRTFFFASYEGLRLLLPRTTSLSVPSRSVREVASPALEPLIDPYPLPTEPDLPTGLARFNSAYSDEYSVDATSARLDQRLSDGLRLFGRYNHSPSSTTERQVSSVTHARPLLQTLTTGLTQTIGASFTHDLRANYSRNEAATRSTIADFGGAVPVPHESLLPIGLSPPSSRMQWNIIGATVIGTQTGNFHRQTQFNLVDTVSWQLPRHAIKLGVDYRELWPVSEPWEYWLTFGSATLDSVIEGVITSATLTTRERVDMRTRNVSAFVNDTWQLGPCATINLGLRWDVNPPPTKTDGTHFVTLTGLERADTIRVAPEGTPLYPTEYGSVAPRVGAALVTSNRHHWEQVLRGGFGVFYDLGAGIATLAADGYPYLRRRSLAPNTPFPFDDVSAAYPPPPSLDPPYVFQSFSGYLNHEAPRTYQWNVAVEQSLGAAQTASVTYVGAAGRALLRREQYTDPNPLFTGQTLVSVTSNTGESDYRALQLQYQHRLSHGVQALVNYTWSQSEDNVSNDSFRLPPSGYLNFAPAVDRAPSDFDLRHVFTAGLTLTSPTSSSGPLAVAFGGWSLDAIVRLQSAFPVNISYGHFPAIGLSYSARPNVAPGVRPILSDPTAPGGRRINPAAFSVPVENGTGNTPRNSLRGFPLRQVDLGLQRQVPVVKGVKLQARVEVFNLFNTANFANPSGNLGNYSNGSLTPSATFGVPSQLIYGALSGTQGLNRLYQVGGPRSVQFSLRCAF